MNVRVFIFSKFLPYFKDSTSTKRSKTSGFNPCSGGGCGHPAVRPLVDTGAMVFVVFGILGVNRTQRTDNHVIGDMVRGQLHDNNDIRCNSIINTVLVVLICSKIISKGQCDIGSKL